MMSPGQDPYGLPPLFTLPSELDKLAAYTPNRGTAGGKGEQSLSSRRSLTPTGSIHTADTTPPRPPPIMRLQDAMMTGGAAARAARRQLCCGAHVPACCAGGSNPTQGITTPGAVVDGPKLISHYESMQIHLTWVWGTQLC